MPEADTRYVAIPLRLGLLVPSSPWGSFWNCGGVKAGGDFAAEVGCSELTVATNVVPRRHLLVAISRMEEMHSSSARFEDHGADASFQSFIHFQRQYI